MKQKIRTEPNFNDSSPAHQQAIKDGDDHFRMWQRNVEDRFKDKQDDEIRETLAKTAFPYAVCFENLINDFNIASAIRNANAFNAREVFYIGDKKFDRRAACGVHNYTDIYWLSTIDDLLSLKDKYTFVGFDNVPGSVPLQEHVWEKDTMLVFGSEGVGLTPAMQALCSKLVYIPQFGSVRSLNVATASGIVMNDFVTRFK